MTPNFFPKQLRYFMLQFIDDDVAFLLVQININFVNPHKISDSDITFYLVENRKSSDIC